MLIEEVLKKLNYVLQEILLTAEIKSNSINSFLTSSYWEVFGKQIEKWLLALENIREGRLEEASELLDEINL